MSRPTVWAGRFAGALAVVGLAVGVCAGPASATAPVGIDPSRYVLAVEGPELKAQAANDTEQTAVPTAPGAPATTAPNPAATSAAQRGPAPTPATVVAKKRTVKKAVVKKAKKTAVKKVSARRTVAARATTATATKAAGRR